MALPALPPLLTSPTETAPPLADEVATPPLPDDATSGLDSSAPKKSLIRPILIPLLESPPVTPRRLIGQRRLRQGHGSWLPRGSCLSPCPPTRAASFPGALPGLRVRTHECGHRCQRIGTPFVRDI